MEFPLVYEINTRCWLRELASHRGKDFLSLADVPTEEFEAWRRLGVTHLWLMGVWTTGPRSRQHALANPEARRACVEALPDWRDEDVGGSPFAVAAYEIPASFGGEEGLARFRERLHEQGLKLLLDFVPNHVGLDHRWIRDQPRFLVPGRPGEPGAFLADTASGPLWLAHGKDPNFPAWADTVQVNLGEPAARRALIAELRAIARRCDGVRCDMAMLLLSEVFRRTWANRAGIRVPTEEFWPAAIEAVRREKPGFLFLAEAYWGLEASLQRLGFDYTYDKEFYDQLVFHNPAATHRHLYEHNPGPFVAAGARFLENHDEARAATKFSPAEHLAAALVTLGLPGLRLLHEGQLTGARIRTPLQLNRRQAEPACLEIRHMYDLLLQALRDSSVGHGDWRLLKPREAGPQNPTWRNFVLVQWESRPPSFDLVVVNLAPHRGQCYAPLTVAGLGRHHWPMRDRLGKDVFSRDGAGLVKAGLYLDLPAHGAQLFHFEPTS